MKKIIGACFLVIYLFQIFYILLVLFCERSFFENKTHYLKHQFIPLFLFHRNNYISSIIVL